MSTGALEFKTVAVLGGSYGGSRAAQVLAAGLPSGWRVVLIDRNSHFNHVYNFPRYAVLPGHEHKAFIPYDNLFDETGEEILHFDYAIYALGSHLPSPIDPWGSRDTKSSHEPRPQRERRSANVGCPYMGTKQEGISWLRARQRKFEAARRVLVVGGGALGIQFASDIAAVYPHRSVTLLHSRSRLLPKFDDTLGEEVHLSLQELGVHVIFGERLDMSSLDSAIAKCHGDQEMISVKTIKGREIQTDLVLLCTGQTPNTSLLHAMDPHTIDPQNGLVQVSRTMQILALKGEDDAFEEAQPDCDVSRSTSPTLCGTVPSSPAETLVELDFTPPAVVSLSATTKDTFVESEADMAHGQHTSVYPHLFAIGDAADAFGAIKAGHTAYYQAEIAARNVIRLIEGAGKARGDDAGSDEDSEDLALEEYTPSLPMIKVSLGLTRSAYEVAGEVGTRDDETEDLGAAVVWRSLGHKDVEEEETWA